MNQQQNNQNNQKQTTTHVPSDVVKAFSKWLNGWDMNIHTQDDIDTENLISQKLIFCFSQIESILHKSDQKVMKKARGTLTPGTNEANEKEVIAMLANQKNDWYKNLKRASSYLTEVKGNLSSIYELKNRRADEIFRLRSENASLKNENAKLKQENNLLRETLK